MAFQLPTISLSLLLLQTTNKPSSSSSPKHQNPCLVVPKSVFQSSQFPTKLETPPPPVVRDVKQEEKKNLSSNPNEGSSSSSSSSNGENNSNHNNKQKNDFYVNLGLAVRTLREDMPLLFTKDLNYDIYRDDITLIDPLNTFTGIEKYKLVFWALRFHGRVLFRDISLEVYRVWQPSENVILIRWNLKGVPRVPWEAKGEFQGTSRYKLDRNGKIYEHKVDNLAFNFPQQLRPAASVLDLVSACPASPNPTFMWGTNVDYSSSWLEFYRAVRWTLDSEGYLLRQEGLVTCSST